jgi:phage-related baseplate assembly protein
VASVRAVITAEVAATLRDLRLVDTAGERLVFRARLADDGEHVMLATGEDDLEELVGYVAAEANHEKDRRRQKRLDQAFHALNDVGDLSR